MKLKRTISMLLVVVMVFGMLPAFLTDAQAATTSTEATIDIWDGSIAAGFSGGNGTEGNPYLISSCAELAYLASSVNGGNSYSGLFFSLKKDLNLDNIPWTPIGDETASFSGYFIGNNHTIKNLYINLPDRDFVGLFGNGARKISSLRINDFYICGHDYVGAFSGRFSEFDDCSLSNGQVNGNDWVGGICGRIFNYTNDNLHVDSIAVCGASDVGGAFGAISPDYTAAVNNCTVVNSNVSGKDCVGGIVGSQYSRAYNSWLTMTDCHNINANVICVNDDNEDFSCSAGGIIGGHFRQNSESRTRIRQCSNRGGVYAENITHRNCVDESCSHTSYAGGIIGYATWTGSNECVNTYNAGTITSVSGDAGGIYGGLGQGGSFKRSSVNNCHNVGEINGKNSHAITKGGPDTNCYYLNGSDSNATQLTSSQFADASNFANWDFTNIWIMSESRGYPILRTSVHDVTSQFAGKQIKIKSVETGKYICGQNESYLHAGSCGSVGTYTVTPMTEDGWVGFKLIGGNYISVSDDENYLLTTAADFAEWECFRIYEYLGYHYLLSHKDMEYVQATKGLAGVIRLLKTEIGQEADLTDATWERFQIEIVGDTQDTEDVTDPFIKAHIDFYQNDYGKIREKLSFSTSKDFVANTNATVAYEVWDMVGDFGNAVALQFDGISVNYYDVFMSEFILQMTNREDKHYEQTCLEKGAELAIKTQKIIADDIATVLLYDNSLMGDLDDLDKDWKEILHWEDAVVFKEKLGKVFSDPDWTMSPKEQVLYDRIFSSYYTQVSTKSIFAGYEATTTLIGTVADGIEAANKLYRAYSIAQSTAEINDEFYSVFRDVLVSMLSKPGMDYSSKEAQAATEFLEVFDKYYKIATDEDEMFEYILKEATLSAASFYWDTFKLKDSVKELGYSIIGKATKVGVPQLKALVATYNGTYKLLDATFKLNDKKKFHCMMACISPIEGGLADTVDSYGKVLVEAPTSENARKFDYAFQCLKGMNSYLYTCLYKYASCFGSSLSEKTREAGKTFMSLASRKQTAWNNASCHSEDVVADYYKTVTTSCPGDVFVYDKDGRCVASVVDEKTTIYDSSVNILVSNAMKAVTFPASLDYRVAVVARETGEMEFGVAEVDPYRYDETNVKSYTGIRLEETKEIFADVGASTQVQETRLLVLDDKKVPKKEILVCGQEVAYYDELPSVTGKVSSYSPQIPVMITLYAQGDRTTPLYRSVSELAVGDGRVVQEFEVSNVIPGDYDVVLTKQGYLPYETKVTITEKDIELPAIQLLLEDIATAVEKTSMVLGNDLSIMFAFTADDIAGTGNYATITKSYADGTADRVERIEQSAWGDPIVIGGKNYYAISFDGVAAKEMTDEVQVQIFNADGTPISEVFTDSIRDYAMRMIEQDINTTMFVDMLIYGAEAQKQFESYGIDDLATSQLTAEQLALATQTVSYENKLVADNGYRASSLILESNIQLAVLFGGIDQTMTAEVSFIDHYGNAKTFTIDGSNFEPVTYKGEACYSITVDELVMADARQLVTVTVKDADGNVVTSATDSVESYIARMSNTGTLYEAIMKFSDSAAAGLKN